MRRVNVTLPRYRLLVQFKIVKRRKSRLAEPLIPSVKLIKKRYRKGSFLGKFFRYIFEHKKLNRTLASGLSFLIIITSYFPPFDAAQAQDGNNLIISADVNLKTEKSVQFPTNQIRITQKFSFYHPGLDLDGTTGDPVKPIKPGKVKSISYSKFSYGNSVIIEHANNISSLYAHLSKIEVKEGQEVNLDTEIGKIGATGRAFGDHLHLEVYDHNKPINPLLILW